MGVVYKAEDIRLGTHRGGQVRSESIANDPVAVERFQREARAVSALNHPNICTLHDIGEVDGTPFLVMECLEGQTVRERILARPHHCGELFDLAIQTSEASGCRSFAGHRASRHQAGEYLRNHRSQIKVMDFGLAKVTAGASSSTEADSRVATAALENTLTNPGSTLAPLPTCRPNRPAAKNWTHARTCTLRRGPLRNGDQSPAVSTAPPPR